ncbi:hypothetical protein, partial [Helcococcus bovis]|uniref:hypothetical protein n=1 Tax=Helcococcus bovis TaxID=3153252 RepID=UPI0038BC45A7
YVYLQIENKKENTNYYLRTKNIDTGKYDKKYIKKEEINTAKNIAQKSYNKKVLKLVNKIIPILTKLNKIFKDDIIDEVFDSLSKGRKDLVNPVIPTKKQLLENWKNEKYKGKPFSPDSIEIYTNRGERVRSKSEKIMADRFDYYNLDYKYEYPLIIGKGTYYPDFVFLDLNTNQKIYWEHFGMMDNIKYCENALRKIEMYELNNINLICTFETSNKIPETKLIDTLIKKHLLDN